ncbi:MAG: hypothetical protein WCR24_07345 [Candidatus Methanomethylophilaceae archaeon]
MRLSSGMSGKRLSSPYTVSGKLTDKTEEMIGRLLPDITDHIVKWKHAVIVGLPGCGKSTTIKFIWSKAVAKYGKDMNFVYTDALAVALDLMDSKRVQFICIDDASKHASSLDNFELKKQIAEFNRIRHVYEDKTGSDTGIIIILFGWQRWKEVHPAFRNGTFMIFKTLMAEPDDNNMIETLIGERASSELRRIWNKMDTDDQTVKGTSIGYLPTQRGSPDAAGLFYTRLVDDDRFPSMIYKDEYFKDEKTVDQILEEHRQNPRDAEAVDAYKLIIEGTMKRRDIAARFGHDPSWVTKVEDRVESWLAKA